MTANRSRRPGTFVGARFEPRNDFGHRIIVFGGSWHEGIEVTSVRVPGWTNLDQTACFEVISHQKPAHQRHTLPGDGCIDRKRRLAQTKVPGRLVLHAQLRKIAGP